MSSITFHASLRPPKNFIHFNDGELQHSLVDRFEQIAGKYPDNVAVTSKNIKITYQLLNESSNRLAHAILSKIGSCSEPVAIILGHDSPAIQAFWGILKSGHAYVTLIPSQPPRESGRSWKTRKHDFSCPTTRISSHAKPHYPRIQRPKLLTWIIWEKAGQLQTRAYQFQLQTWHTLSTHLAQLERRKEQSSFTRM